MSDVPSILDPLASSIALNIAMDYLMRTGQAVKFQEAQEVAAHAKEVAWRSQVRNRLRLSNLAIRAVEQREDFTEERLGVLR